MFKKLLFVPMIALVTITFSACTTTGTTPSVPGLAQLVPVAQAVVAAEVTSGKLSAAQGAQIDQALTAVQGNNLNLATLGSLALQAAVASGKVTPAQAAEIQAILTALNAANAQTPPGTVVVPVPTPTSTPAA